MNTEVELAIAEVTGRFSEWEPTPTMLGFARAVGAAMIANTRHPGVAGLRAALEPCPLQGCVILQPHTHDPADRSKITLGAPPLDIRALHDMEEGDLKHPFSNKDTSNGRP